MAETIDLPDGRAKIRNLWIVALLLIVTIGIYYLYWYYAINRELRDFGRRQSKLLDIRPGVALLATTIGWYVIVPPFVSAWRTVRRVKIAEGIAGIQPQHGINHVLGFVMFVIGFILLPIEVFYLQLHLNRMWRHLLDEEEKRRAGMRGVAA